MAAKIINIKPYLKDEPMKKLKTKASVYQLAPDPHHSYLRCKCGGTGWYYCTGTVLLGCKDVKVKHIHACICCKWLRDETEREKTSLRKTLEALTKDMHNDGNITGLDTDDDLDPDPDYGL